MRFEKTEYSKWNLFILLFLCFAAAILGDSTSESLLLSHFDAQYIPRMYLVNAIALFVISFVIMPVFDRVNRGSFFVYGMLGHIAILCLIRVAVIGKWNFLFGPLFSYAYVTKIIIFLTFWTLANDLFDSRKAGKTFPVIAAGGTLGAILISFSIPLLMKFFTAENLLLIWILLLISAVALFLPIKAGYGRFFISRSDQNNVKKSGGILSDLRVIRNEPLLRNMSLLYLALFFLLLNQHFTFYAQVKAHFTNANQMVSFLGYFNGISMFLTFVLQLTISGKLMKAAGLTRSMLMLPFVLMLIFASQILIVHFSKTDGSYFFWAVIGRMGLRIACFDSLFSPNFQVFFSSLPKEIRGRGKLAIEGIVKPLAILGSGIFLMWVMPHLSMTLNICLLLIISVFVAVQTLRLKGRYTKSLTGHLSGYSSKKHLVFLDQLVGALEEHSFDSLRQRLQTESTEVQEFIIELLSNSSSKEATAILTESLDCIDKKIRATLVSSIGKLKRIEFKDRLLKFLSDPDARVVANAVQALAAYDDKSIYKKIEPLLHHSSNRVRANVVIALWPFAGEVDKVKMIEVLRSMLGCNDPAVKASALYALGEIESDLALNMIINFYERNSDDCKKNQMIFLQLARAVSKKTDLRSVDLLLHLALQQNQMRTLMVVQYLGVLLEGFPEKTIIKLLTNKNQFNRQLIIRALHNEALSMSSAVQGLFRNIVAEELQRVENTFNYLDILHGNSNKGVLLLYWALIEEYITVYISMLTCVASMLDKSGLIRQIIPRLSHADAHVRGRAFEVLDNAGDQKINRLLMSLIEKSERYRATAAFERKDPDMVFEVIEKCKCGGNEWVSTIASYAAICMFKESPDEKWCKLIKESNPDLIYSTGIL